MARGFVEYRPTQLQSVELGKLHQTKLLILVTLY